MNLNASVRCLQARRLLIRVCRVVAADVCLYHEQSFLNEYMSMMREAGFSEQEPLYVASALFTYEAVGGQHSD